MGPPPSTTNYFRGIIQFMMFPEDILITKTDDMVTMIFNYLSNAPSVVPGTMYIMGGKIPAADDATPLKKDWALTCDPDWTKEDKEKKCLSFQETAWGTDILAKLERIHSSVDPDRLF